jgi:hypothetical protein
VAARADSTYLIRFAQEAAWREDHRKEPNGLQVDRLVGLATHNKPSVDKLYASAVRLNSARTFSRPRVRKYPWTGSFQIPKGVVEEAACHIN